MIRDVHTHNPAACDAIINVEPGFSAYRHDALYSIGIHPWNTPLATPQLLAALEAEAARPEIVAIGEAGLDKLKGGPLDKQIELFEKQVALSEKLAKPLIVHCVRAWAELLEVHRRLRPRQPWIIHGFRGKPQLARQLLANGLYLSVGEKCNPDTLAVIPPDRLLRETDDSPVLSSSLPPSTLAERLFTPLSEQTSRTPGAE